MSAGAPDPLVGSTLGRYRILAKLGEGGMGVVYRALDTALDRHVALKVLPPHMLDDPGARETLLREARTASHLNHPHVCTIHEVGQDGERVYVAMEFVEGRPLRELIPAGGLADETVVRYGAQLARALAHAHERKVVHRDLKVANVVIAADGQAKLLDFGLSRRILEEMPGDSAPVPTAGEVAGTPQYLAPEVLMGSRAGARSDIWSLGVVLYEMCSAGVPFPGGPVGSVVTAILHATPAALPEHTGPGLRAIVARCLAKDPAQRYRSADEVAAALEALLPDARPREGVARRWSYPLRRLGRRVWTTLGVVLLAAAAVVAWRLWGPGPGGLESRTVLVLPLEVRGQVRDADFAGRAFAEALAIDLAHAARVRVMPVPARGEMGSVSTLGKARAALFAGAGRLVVGAITREGDSLRVSLSLVDTRANQVLWGDRRAASAGDLAVLASSMAETLAEQLGERPARRYDYFMYVTGPAPMAVSPEMTEAVGAVRRYELPGSLESTRRLLARFPRETDAHVLRLAAQMIDMAAAGPDTARVGTIATELEALHRLDPSSPWYDTGRAILMRSDDASIRLLSQVAARADLTPAARGAVLAVRADRQGARGETAAAIADAEQAVQLDPASDLSLSTLARALARAGRYRDAAQRVRQAVALNPTVVNYWLQLGNCMLKLGQWHEYVADLDRAATLSPDADAILSAQSDGLSCLGRYDEAAERARRALRLKPSRWFYGLQLALSLMRMGRWNEAGPLLERACTQGYPVNCPIHDAARAVTLLLAGDDAAAQRQARHVSDMIAAGPVVGTVESKSSNYALACYHARRGEHDAALRLLERFPERGWIEPALARDPNLAVLRADARFQRLATWMGSQPISRVFSEWGRSP